MRTALLLSGGMDSAALAFWYKPELAVTIDYGHIPAPGEIRAASAIADALAIEHHIITVNLSDLGSGDLAGSQASDLAAVSEWWPFRNQMLVTLAAMKIVPRGIRKLLIGTIANDCVHADGKPEFVHALDSLLRLQEGELQIEAPAIYLNTPDLCRQSGIPTEILSWAHSCHKCEYACGMCRGCKKHYETYQALGLDPY